MAPLKELIISRNSLATYPERKDIVALTQSSSSRKSFTSRFIAALALFLVIDLVVRFQFHPDPYGLPERSFIWWAVQDYKQLKQTPTVMLFGSSLMLAMVNEGDAAHYNKLIDTATHHRSDYLQDLLKNQLSKPVSTFSFAIGGQMASDVYAIASNFIKPQSKPKLIIWGIAPRDLLDSAFPGAISSDTAQYMNKIAGYDLIAHEHTNLNSILDQCLRQVCSIYSHHLDFLAALKQSLRTLQTEKTFPLLTQKSDATDSAGRATMVRQLMNPRDGSMGDIEIGEWLISANASPSKELKDNTHEYFVRYNPFKPKTFTAQTIYMQKFLQQQKDLGVKVVLVNMPLTQKNMNLLPAGLYDKYLFTVKQSAANYGAIVVDFNHDPHFSVSDFFDAVHLNGLGSEKLLKLIADTKKITESNL